MLAVSYTVKAFFIFPGVSSCFYKHESLSATDFGDENSYKSLQIDIEVLAQLPA